MGDVVVYNALKGEVQLPSKHAESKHNTTWFHLNHYMDSISHKGVHDLSYLKGFGLAYPSPEQCLSGGMLGRVFWLL